MKCTCVYICVYILNYMKASPRRNVFVFVAMNLQPRVSERLWVYSYALTCMCVCIREMCVCVLVGGCKRVGYEWVEALGWTRKETQDGERADEWYYHWKSGEIHTYMHTYLSISISMSNVSV